MEKKPIIVTTARKGVFFGYGEISDSKTIKLENARMCVYWPQENHGVVGLAASGPLKGARISPPAPSIILQDVTSVMEVSKEAEVNWEKGLWN
jgi:hypothetical protein